MKVVNMKALQSLLISISFAVLLFAGATNAATIDCSTVGCIGGIYTLDIASAGGSSYLATYTIDTTGSYDVAATMLNDIEFKVANDYSNVSVLSGPTGIVQDGPLGGHGCVGSNDSFICINVSPDLALGHVYTWEVAFDSSQILTETDWHLGARYSSGRHGNGWIISESPSPAVPEPTAALLFGVGMLTVGVATQRRGLVA